MIVDVEKPGSPEDVLAHFGKKGMKWGVRRASRTSFSTTQKFKKTNPSNAKRTQAIRKARASAYTTSENWRSSPRGSAERARAKTAHLNNPDRATQLRLTRGEKTIFGVLALTGVFTVPIVVGVGARVAIRKHIEKQQRNG